MVLWAGITNAASPEAKTVPFAANAPLVPHDIVTGIGGGGGGFGPLTSITISSLSTCGTDAQIFSLNGTEVGQLNVSDAHCTCGPPVTSLTTTDAGLLALWNSAAITANTFSLQKPGTVTHYGWAKVVVSDGTSTVETCVLDRSGGDCTTSNLCQNNSTQSVDTCAVAGAVGGAEGETTLKGVALDADGDLDSFEWLPGDGSPPITCALSGGFANVEAKHVYVGAPGSIFTATLTVCDAAANCSSANYFLRIRAKTLEVEVNIAIDEGLWYLHKTQQRSATAGDWLSGGQAASGNFSNSASNILAFEVSGHLESGDASNPYTDTVARALRSLFTWLSTSAVSSQTNPQGTFDPDGNGNGLGVRVNQGNELYQGGMLMDAIVAAGDPNAVTTTGSAGIVGRRYADIIQDMVDYYAYCQYDGAAGGGWRYACNQAPDNSANQWAAIGIIPAERNFGATVPGIVKTWNEVWLAFSQASNGSFGYENTSAIWGPYAVTPSGMVQMVMDEFGRGDSRWDNAETFLRDNFGNTGGPTNAIKEYYYGLFSFTKAMLLHPVTGTCVALVCSGGGRDGEACDEDADPPRLCVGPIDLLGRDLDWYGAEASGGDPTDGVARTLVDDQNPAGFWSGHDFSSSQFPFETGWAIVMLRRTVVDLLPVAVVSAVPNPGEVNQTINLDCSDSFHQNPERMIVAWDWDLDDDGACDDASGSTTTTSFPALGTFQVRCCVTDGGDAVGQNVLTNDAVVFVIITIPPIKPSAEAGGPYILCDDTKPWFLDGTGSVNPDDGQSEPGAPPDFIQSYDWDLDGDNATDVSGAQPDVTAFFTGLGAGPPDHFIGLTVTDNTALSFPISGLGDQSDTDSAEVRVRDPNDPECQGCTVALTATAAAPGVVEVQLSWTAQAGASGYNVYRSTVPGGPYVLVASTPDLEYLDTDFECPVEDTHFYIVWATLLNGDEFCRSNEDSAIPICCGDGVIDSPGEDCDDGNTQPGDGCSATCTIEAGFQCTGEPSICTLIFICGDGIIDATEECEDGNTNPGDGCDENCLIERACCNNLGVTCTSTDDSPCTALGDTCCFGFCGSEDCSELFPQTCDDPQVCAGGELCCAPICGFCGDGIRLCTEECDLGQANCDPGVCCESRCTSDCGVTGLCTVGQGCCVTEVDCPPEEGCCGNGKVEGDEECDDGNNQDFDCCSSSCQIENDPDCAPLSICAGVFGPHLITNPEIRRTVLKDKTGDPALDFWVTRTIFIREDGDRIDPEVETVQFQISENDGTNQAQATSLYLAILDPNSCLPDAACFEPKQTDSAGNVRRWIFRLAGGDPDIPGAEGWQFGKIARVPNTFDEFNVVFRGKEAPILTPTLQGSVRRVRQEIRIGDTCITRRLDCAPNAKKTRFLCRAARCGNGVRDRGERCGEGTATPGCRGAKVCDTCRCVDP